MPRLKVPEPIEPYLADLEHDDYRVRREAVKQLGKTRNPDAVPYLIARLQDKTVNVRLNTIRALEKFKDERVIEPLIEQLGHQSCDVHQPAFESLMAFGSAAVPALIEALRHKKRDVRGMAAGVLGSLKAVEAVEPLIAALADKDTYVLTHVCAALGSIHDERAIKPLLRLVDRDPATFVVKDAHAVGKISPERLQCKALDTLVYLGHVPSVIRLMEAAPGVYNITGLYGGLQQRAQQGEVAAQQMLDICDNYLPEKVRKPQ